jgi:hypothetical protein
LGTAKAKEGQIMIDDDRECVMCGGKEGLIPLYADKAPEAQPVAWVHTECLSRQEEDDDTSDE